MVMGWILLMAPLWHRTRLRIPNLGGVLRDRAVARELAGARDIEDGLACPSVAIGVQLGQPVVLPWSIAVKVPTNRHPGRRHIGACNKKAGVRRSVTHRMPRPKFLFVEALKSGFLR